MKKLLIIIFAFLISLTFVNQVKAEGVADEIMGQVGVGADSAQLGYESSIQMTIVGIINIVLSVVGIIFVALLVYGGFKYFNSQGQEEQAKEGMSIIMAAIIGLIIILLSYAITNFVVKKSQQAVLGGGVINVRD